MPAITVLTEAQLATFMHGWLGRTATLLSFTDPDSYENVISQALMDMSVETIDSLSGIANMRALLAVSKYRLWEHILNITASGYDFSVDGGSFSKSQFHEHALAMMQSALTDAIIYLPNLVVTPLPVYYNYSQGDTAYDDPAYNP